MKLFVKSAALALALASIVLLDAGAASASDRPGTNAARPAAIRFERPGSARNSTRPAADPSLGFNVVNLSSHPIKLRLITGNAKLDGHTPVGSILGAKSSDVHFFNVQSKFLGVTMAFAHYQILGDHGEQIGEFEAVMKVTDTGFGLVRSNTRCMTSLGHCDVSPKEDVITLFDPHERPGAGRGDIWLVYNLSTRPIKFINLAIINNSKFPARPDNGEILGAKRAWQQFKVVLALFVETGGNAHYAILGDHGQEIGRIEVRMRADVTGQRAACITPGGSALCGPSPAQDVIFVHTAG